MSKRKFAEVNKEWEKSQTLKRGPDKNSLDSDEEDEVEGNKYCLQDEDIEGQEEGGVILEEGVQFTPFNMKEEMEEGHFDTDGMYHWKKDKEIKDSWLDNIDWVKIKERKEMNPQSESDDEMPESENKLALYKKLLGYMDPKETIGKTLRRLGGNKSLSASERLKLKKAGLLPAVPSKDEQEKVTVFTEIANKILTQTGNMDVYQETFEYITDLVSASSSKSQKEPELDMYADDFGSKEEERLKESSGVEQKSENQTAAHGETMWEFKWSLESENLEGPHTTQQMEKWAQSGHFKKGAFARRCGTTNFYNTNRIDFDLYL